MRYDRPNTPADELRDFFLRGGIPVTLGLLAVTVGIFLADFFGTEGVKFFLLTHIAFMPAYAKEAPWTLLTYPLYASGFLNVLISGFFLWLAGGSLERSWGSRRFAVFFFALTAISGLSLLAGYYLYTRDIPALSGNGLPLGGMIVAFCMLNPNLTLRLYFFPLRALYIAWIVALLTYFGAGMGPVLNLFACGGIIAAFLYVRFARSWADIGSYRAPARGPDLRVYPQAKTASKRRTILDGSRVRRPFDLAGQWRDYQERRRLERLLRNSGFSDREPGWRDDEEHRPR